MIKIRKAEKSDMAEYLKLRMQLWPECSIERHKLEIASIASSSGFTLLAELSNSEPVGFAEISIRNDHVEGTSKSPVPYLEGWYIKPNQQGSGVGRALVEAAEDMVSQMGFDEIASDAELSNQSSIKIHKKIGFKEVGRTVHFVKAIQ